MIGGRSMAPVKGSVHWLLVAILLWEGLELLRNSGPATFAGRPIGFFELLLVTLAPFLITLGFVRLFVAVIDSGYGSLNAYMLTSSPLAWGFWAGLALTLAGHGEHAGAHILNQAVPEVVRHGDFGVMAQFFDETLGHWLLGLGLFSMSAVILVLGQGAAQRVMGGERMLLIAGSFLTYGAGILYVGVGEQMLAPAIVAAAGLTAVGFRHLSSWDVNNDPVSLLIVPGAAVAGIVLITWGVVVGGQPAWPW